MALFDLIDAASKFIDICTFILGRDDFDAWFKQERLPARIYQAKQPGLLRDLLEGLLLWVAFQI